MPPTYSFATDQVGDGMKLAFYFGICNDAFKLLFVEAVDLVAVVVIAEIIAAVFVVIGEIRVGIRKAAICVPWCFRPVDEGIGGCHKLICFELVS